ncbi:hypothetical protein L1987_53910 [Smallanthus sonchifolius]|uniref:Uncharacterized protein n=1 Tax=Smallanthus sonchifolius TaxID=185202 RepID=A0ACB9E5S0_9ASTR|nr:hypothetical protein L1987_53910 [Smallanthus sonchifolius]
MDRKDGRSIRRKGAGRGGSNRANGNKNSGHIEMRIHPKQLHQIHLFLPLFVSVWGHLGLGMGPFLLCGRPRNTLVHGV